MLTRVARAAYLALLVLVTVPAMAQPPQTQTTDVLVMLTVKPAVQRERILNVMPDEIRATVRLYLEGKIRQWCARSDGRGVVFILGCQDVAQARSIMETLPLSRHNFVDLEYTPMGPLTPLRLLLTDSVPRQ